MQHRRMIGVAHIDLNKKDLEFYTLGPAGGVNFVAGAGPEACLRPRVGASAAISSGRSISNSGRSHSRMEFDGRPRMSLKTSSNGKLLYIYNAGNTIDLYEAATYNTSARSTSTATSRRVLRRAETGRDEIASPTRHANSAITVEVDDAQDHCGESDGFGLSDRRRTAVDVDGR